MINKNCLEANKHDEYLRDIIIVALVRIAQQGNIIAREEIIKHVHFIIDEWIEVILGRGKD